MFFTEQPKKKKKLNNSDAQPVVEQYTTESFFDIYGVPVDFQGNFTFNDPVAEYHADLDQVFSFEEDDEQQRNSNYLQSVVEGTAPVEPPFWVTPQQGMEYRLDTPPPSFHPYQPSPDAFETHLESTYTHGPVTSWGGLNQGMPSSSSQFWENTSNSSRYSMEAPPSTVTPSFFHTGFASSVSPEVSNTVRTGFRLGVATWNAGHVLEKDRNTPWKDSINFRAALAPLQEVMVLRDRLAATIPGLTKKVVRKKVVDVVEEFDKLLLDDRDWWYLHSVFLRYENLTGERVFSSKPAAPFGADDVRGAIEQLKSKITEIAPKLRERLKSVKKKARRAAGLAAIKQMFLKHEWLDVLVLQEVKYTGIDILLQYVAENMPDVDVWPGVRLVSRGKESNTEEAKINDGQVEHYPILTRKVSNNRMPLQLQKHAISVVAVRYSTTGGKVETLTKSPGPTVLANQSYRWDKKSDAYRPVVIYDVRVGGERGPVVHLGVLHTSPEGGGEFEREAEFKQLAKTFELMSQCAAGEGEDPALAGPWLLGGDYYLFREARVVRNQDIPPKLILDEYLFRKKEFAAIEGFVEEFRKQKRFCTNQKGPALQDRIQANFKTLAQWGLGVYPEIRGMVWRKREVWLRKMPDRTRSRNALLAEQAKLYESLEELCKRYRDLGKKYTASEQLGQDHDKRLSILTSTNQNWLKFFGKVAKGKTPIGIGVAVQSDPMRNWRSTFETRLKDMKLVITQVISGTNVQAHDQFGLEGPTQELRNTLRVADFFVHTSAEFMGGGHWRCQMIGLLSPDEGSIVMVDSDQRVVSQFWAALADHFPSGGLFSTDDGLFEPVAVGAIQRKSAPSEQVLREFRELRAKRRVRKAKDLQKLGSLILEPDHKALQVKIGELSSEDVLAYIREMERYLKITVETRANEEEAPKSKDELVYQEEVIDTGDYGWNGDLSFPEPRTPQIQESTDGTEKEEEAVDPDGEGDDEEELLVIDEAELED